MTKDVLQVIPRFPVFTDKRVVRGFPARRNPEGNQDHDREIVF